MTKLNTGSSNFSNDALYHLGLTVAYHVAAIPDFAAQKPSLLAVAAAATARTRDRGATWRARW